MSAADHPSDDHTLHVVMNGRVVGGIVRTGKNKARLRYEDAAADAFTPLSVSMPGPTRRYRETVLVPWVEALLPDRPETIRQWRRRFGVTEQGPLSLLPHVGEDVAGAAQFVRPSRLDVVLVRSECRLSRASNIRAERWDDQALGSERPNVHTRGSSAVLPRPTFGRSCRAR